MTAMVTGYAKCPETVSTYVKTVKDRFPWHGRHT